MSRETYSYLVSGRSRGEIAAALVEYRAFVQAHPEDELAVLLMDVSRKMRVALAERRRVARALAA